MDFDDVSKNEKEKVQGHACDRDVEQIKRT
jgi:hypothetical protein